MTADLIDALEKIADDDELLEVGRRAIEDLLVSLRDSRLSVMTNNGLVIKEQSGEESSIIRFGPEVALREGLKVIAQHLRRS